MSEETSTEVAPTPEQAPVAPQGTHYLVPVALLQQTYNYLGTKPAAEVMELMNELNKQATSVVLNTNENQT